MVRTLFEHSWPCVRTRAMDTKCSPIDTPVDTFGIVLGSVLATATFLLPLPQAGKLLRQRSSAGLSPYTLALTVLFAGSQVGATVGLKWRQLEACAQGPACVADLLDLVQQAASWLTWLATAIICVSLPPHRSALPRAATALSIACTAALVAVSAVVSADAPCQPPALTLSQALGWVAAVAAATQYGPQLYETWRHGSAGSLSYATYTLQTVGSAAVVANNAFLNHDGWRSWLSEVGYWWLVITLLCGGGPQLATPASSDGPANPHPHPNSSPHPHPHPHPSTTQARLATAPRGDRDAVWRAPAHRVPQATPEVRGAGRLRGRLPALFAIRAVRAA